eukprot:m.67298 g.67298  ORF g.67298 m.67298 type:complete len:140 (-) comp7672_c0_seq2:2285-2704(-)
MPHLHAAHLLLQSDNYVAHAGCVCVHIIYRPATAIASVMFSCGCLVYVSRFVCFLLSARARNSWRVLAPTQDFVCLPFCSYLVLNPAIFNDLGMSPCTFRLFSVLCSTVQFVLVCLHSRLLQRAPAAHLPWSSIFTFHP